jgi:hypothetical protein
MKGNPMPHELSFAPPWVIPWNSERLSNESVRRSVELASMALDERVEASDPSDMQGEHHRRSGPLRRRRAIIALSLIGFAGTLGSLYRMGFFRNLFEPHGRRIRRARTPVSFTTDQEHPPMP